MKSAYYMARRILGKEVHVQNTRNFVWGAIWKARVTPKVKVFVWRMIQGILPAGSALQCRGLQVDNRCSVCGCFGDTFAHIFIFCRLSFVVWQTLDFEVMLS